MIAVADFDDADFDDFDDAQELPAGHPQTWGEYSFRAGFVWNDEWAVDLITAFVPLGAIALVIGPWRCVVSWPVALAG